MNALLPFIAAIIIILFGGLSNRFFYVTLLLGSAINLLACLLHGIDFGCSWAFNLSTIALSGIAYIISGFLGYKCSLTERRKPILKPFVFGLLIAIPSWLLLVFYVK